MKILRGAAETLFTGVSTPWLLWTTNRQAAWRGGDTKNLLMSDYSKLRYCNCRRAAVGCAIRIPKKQKQKVPIKFLLVIEEQ